MSAEVHGTVAPGFEGVRDAFATYADLGEGGAAYAAWHDGRLVVDLWAGRAGDRAWERDTMGNFMSTSKALTAAVVMRMADRGDLDVDAPIAAVWPEFAAAGKGAITLREVMSHRSGVVGSPEVSAAVDLEVGTGFADEPYLAGLLAQAPPVWEPGTAAGYHTMAYGWIVGETVRRATGTTVGTVLARELAGPLGAPDARIGTPSEHHDRIAPVLPLAFPEALPPEGRQYWEHVLAEGRKPQGAPGLSMQGDGERNVLDAVPTIWGRSENVEVEMLGSNLTGTARDVAKVFAALASDDGLAGVRVASRSARDDFGQVIDESQDVVLFLPIARATGFWRNISLIEGRPQGFGPNTETLGHTGFGGQFGFADPVANVGVAHVRSQHTTFPILGLMLNTALYAAISEQG